MAEKKKTISAQRTTTKKNTAKASPKRSTGTRRRTATKKQSGNSPFFEGMGNEITGIILIGFGLLLTAGIFTDRTGRVGDFLKSFALSSFGTLAYLFPILLVTLGLAFILKRSSFLCNRRSLGVLIILISFLIMLSVGHMYLLEDMSLRKALSEIAGLRDQNHGGVVGFVLAFPLIRLVGEVGTYIFGILAVILGAVLMLNTTVYDSLKKGQSATETMQNKISEFREQNQALADDAMKPSDRVASPAAFCEEAKPPQWAKDRTLARDREREEFTYHSFNGTGKKTLRVDSHGKTEDETPSKQKTLPEKGSQAEPPKLTLPPFLDQPTAGQSLKGKEATSAGRFNIELKGTRRDQAPGAAKGAVSNTEQGKNSETINPITVPYLESWNQIRDKKNPRLDELKALDAKTPKEENNSPEVGYGLEGNFQRNVTEGEKKNEELIKSLEGQPGKAQAMSLEDYQSYRKNHLAQTDPPKADKGRQLEMEETATRKKPEYRHPGVSLLKENMRGIMNDDDHQEIMETARKLQETLGTFGVDARVIDVSRGPSVTRYELQLKAGIKVSKVTNLADDIALSLAASGVRIEAPIPGKAAVGIEIPNKETVPVFLREVIDSEKFEKSSQKLAIALGKDISGDVIIGDLAKYPHVLIAGATGSGKSVCINAMIVSLLYKYSPEDVRLIMIDPKMVELSVYNGIPHLLIPVVTDPKKAAGALNWAVNEMTRRYDLFNSNSVRNIESYNDLKTKGKIEEKLPYIVVIVDELADLMMVAASEVENYIARLAQMARAAGMHLVIATQRPSVDVITGVIKANIPSRISFAVSSYVDSKTILDQGGAEKLLGKGDMLYNPMGAHKPKRVQGAFISEDEVESIVSSVKVVEEDLQYDESIIQHIESGGTGRGGQEEEPDELLDEAIRIVIENNQASTSFLQRKMRIGYNRAARIIDDLEARGVISGPDGAKPRKIIWAGEELNHQDD